MKFSYKIYDEKYFFWNSKKYANVGLSLNHRQRSEISTLVVYKWFWILNLIGIHNQLETILEEISERRR